MLTYLRYALAIFCFAASVGCLGLWGWTRLDLSCRLVVQHVRPPPTTPYFLLECMAVQAALSVTRDDFVGPMWRFQLSQINDEGLAHFYRNLRGSGTLHVTRMDRTTLFGCPLWYPALLFALAGVASLRLGRRLTLRSAIIATTIAAGLLGMAVGL